MIFSVLVNYKNLQTISLFPRLYMYQGFFFKISIYFVLVLLLIRFPIKNMLDSLFLVYFIIFLAVLLFVFPWKKLDANLEKFGGKK